MSENFKSGFVSIIGRPNVGKSTLINNIMNQKLSITSPKPQTTRNKIQTILTKDDYQIIFLDTPGIHKSKSKLGEYMNKSVDISVNEADIIVYMVEPRDFVSNKDLDIIKRFENIKSKVFLIINKVDSLQKDKLFKIIENYRKLYNFDEIVPISALKSDNVEELLQIIKKYLPLGPQYFPEDMITNQQEKQIISELIREKALILLQDEIPHGIAVEIMSFKNNPKNNIINIEANIYCEKDSHKGIIIGKNGSVLKSIGTKARPEIENLIDNKVYLQLWVKVKKEWRHNDFLLKNFGYDKKNI